MRLSYRRELDEYPEGLRRLWILAMVVLAILIGSYEAQIAPVLPLLLTDLHMDLTTYGSVSAVATVSGAIAAAAGHRLGNFRLPQPDHGGARAVGGTADGSSNQLADLAVDLAGVPAAVRPGGVLLRRTLAARAPG